MHGNIISKKTHIFSVIMVIISALSFAHQTFAETEEEKLARVIAEEKALVFDKFDHQTALEVGMKMVEYAQKNNLPQTVFHIERNGQILFRVSLAGSSVDNEHWVNEKIAVVHRFLVSSMRKKLEYNSMKGAEWLNGFPTGGGDAVKFWGLSHEEAVGLVGGGFPIYVKNAGFVGTIVSSGGPDETDHDLIVAVLKDYLKK